MPKLFAEYRSLLIVAIFVATCVQGLAAGAAALGTRELFADLHHDITPSLVWIAVLCASGVMIGLLRVFARVVGEHASHSYVVGIREALFIHASQMDAKAVHARRIGNMSLRFVGDLTAFRNWIALGVPRMMAGVVLIPVTLLVLAYIHRPFFVITLPMVIVGLVVIFLGGFILPRRHRTLRSRRAALAADMAERMPIAPQLGLLGRRTKELKLIRHKSSQLLHAALARVRCAQSLEATTDVLAGVAAAGLIWIGAKTGASTSAIAGGLAALGILWMPMRDLASVWNYWSAHQVARDKCLKALNRPQRARVSQGEADQHGALSVEFQGVDIGRRHLPDMCISRGELVKVKGINGSGKTRLLMALSGLDDPCGGSILLSSDHVSKIIPCNLQQKIALINDSPPLLSGSLRRALSLGLPKRPTDAALLELAHRVGFTALTNSQKGLDKRVNEGGRGMSSSELVKISLVRAMLRQPGLVLIDQQAAYLDASARHALEEWLVSLSATVVVVDELNMFDFDYDRIIDLDSCYR